METYKQEKINFKSILVELGDGFLGILIGSKEWIYTVPFLLFL